MIYKVGPILESCIILRFMLRAEDSMSRFLVVCVLPLRNEMIQLMQYAGKGSLDSFSKRFSYVKRFRKINEQATNKYIGLQQPCHMMHKINKSARTLYYQLDGNRIDEQYNKD